MENRIKEHPIVHVIEREELVFYWQKQPMKAKKGEMLASALIANGIKIFGHHHKDGSAQGIFCANGQCSKCMVIANGMPVKSCMTEVKANMIVESAEGLPELPDTNETLEMHDIEELKTDILIIGGGPSGLAAAIQLGEHNINCLLIDDKNELGGKLVLQTHKFFGSVADSFAGTRGNDIGKKLSETVESIKSVTIWTNSTALFVFKDKKVGILKDGVYKIVKPKIILNAAGAREKFLRFSGNSLANIYGAGAFQTLVNRDLVKASNRLFIIGGGNVGLIAGYHALQAGIEVVGLAEAMNKCGGYKVHADKLKRLGVPIYTSHTILSANGDESVSSVTIAELDDKFKVIPNTEKSFACDTILIAVGLDSIKEFTEEAETAGIKVFSAGDALEIAEASSAMFNGKIIGLKIAQEMGAPVGEVPQEWYDKAAILKSHPGAILPYQKIEVEEGVRPNIHCLQEIPCNPCTSVCPTQSIIIEGTSIMGQPQYKGSCIGCGKCLFICPGLAISLLDYRKDTDNPIVSLPYEITNIPVKVGDKLKVVDIDANDLGEFAAISITNNPANKTQMVKVQMPKDLAIKAISFKVQDESISKALPQPIIPDKLEDDTMVCLCERVSVADVKKWIKRGVTDMNQLKAITRIGMGPCGAKTCDVTLRQIFRQEGIPVEEIIANTRRPIFVEASFEVFADGKK
ncbi:MAG: FAD-dependent oxidoreductase [Candidatus Cloacimonadales bacterium]|jgi:NADPH-dependent 2,4-dienoyl-CoA reductase/sulfur reductase-like enzyme/Fe-S-cluster-containing hydrogenase component 2/bacterioferritin-associated ferredoxin|nr:FAD-dependent oxidoreductase [Candidatus Cloacimonadota bacterium]MDX9977479.1 FAD-dependent oxidoreductase [Candidatus Cloacimonadales bacterium]